MAASRTMILLDPDLAPISTSTVEPNDRLPSAQTLTRFLKTAQTEVRLRGAVSVLLTSDAAIKRLNKTFRGKNKATDVLSFPAAEQSRGEVAGDLAISIDTARKQAREHGHALSVEIKVLMLHGLLHLAGYDHELDNGRMARREQTLRNKLALPLGLIERTRGAAEPPIRSARRAVGPTAGGFSRAEKRPEKSRASALEERTARRVRPTPAADRGRR